MFILNEAEYAEKCLREGIVDKNPYQVISILAKYYYHRFNRKPKQIKELLIEYLSRYYPRYELNEEQWLTAVERLATNSKKWKLYEFAGVKITKKEFETIRNIKNKSLEKLAFTSLCLAKAHNLRNPKNNGWVNTDTAEVFKAARINCSTLEQDLKLNKLHQRRLVDFPKQNDNLNFRITFCDSDGEEEIFVSDFRELGYEYLNHIGAKFIRCAECGILTPPGDTNKKKYCEKHKSKKEPMMTKTIICIDCGKQVEVSAKNSKTCRCFECQESVNREKKRLWKQQNNKK